MGLGRDVRVDPDAHRYVHPLRFGDRGQPVELLERLDVQVADPGPHGLTELVGGLPHPAEDDPVRREAGRERTRHLAGRDDVGAGTQIAQEAEHGERAVGLHRVADPMRHAGQRLVERPIPLADRLGVVDVGRRADLGGDVDEGDAGQVERATAARQPRVGEAGVGQYALAHTASATLGRPHHMHVVGGSGERNSSSGRTRIVALVCSLISASQVPRPQKPA